ncbi:SDR family oxidoreductase [Clostridium sp. JNZ J1-5]
MIEKTIFDLHEKVVLITGGSGYLGTAMSEILSEFGANLVMASRDEQKNLKLKQNLEYKYGNHVETMNLDISNSIMINEVVENILKKYGKIDVLINNSYFGAGAELLNMSEEDWNKGIDGSINGVFRLTKAVLISMIEKRYGKIINIASMYGIVAPDVSIYEGNNFYNPANYGIGKAGIIQFTKYIAAVYGKYGITCNCVSPGPFPNDSVQKNEKFINNLERKVPLGRIGKPEELKGVIALLSSDASSYINGANISVDGGWTIW